MKHLKKFNENFDSYYTKSELEWDRKYADGSKIAPETEFNKFQGIDISDIKSFEFYWNSPSYGGLSVPFMSSYKKIGGENDKISPYGDADKRNDIVQTMRNIISDNNITMSEFGDLLKKNFGDKVVYSTRQDNKGGFKMIVEGEDVRLFFELFENLETYMVKEIEK